MKLYDNVVTLRVRVKMPSESTKDHALSEKLCADVNADGKSLRVRKDLFKLRPIQKWRDKARKLLREECVPWSSVRSDKFGNKKEDALWACSGRQIEKIAAELQDYREKFDTEVRGFVDRYDELLEEAKERLGAAFNPDDFPSKEEFAARFDWEVEVKPLQEIADMAEDFRTKLPQKMAEEQVRLAEEKLKARMENGRTAVLGRVREVIMGDNTNPGLIPRLKDYDPDPDDARVGNTFRDKSIYDNIDDMQEWCEAMNDFLDDDAIKDLIGRIDHFRKKVRPKNPEDIRNNEDVRKKVIQGLTDVLDSARPTAGAAGGFGQFT